jgi:hypothetical protein
MGLYSNKTVLIDGIEFRLSGLKIGSKLIGYFLQPINEFPEKEKK